MSLIGLLVVVIIVCLIYWAIHRVAGVFGLPPQILVLIDVVLVVVIVLYLLQAFGVLRVGNVSLR
jgi:hypothetical protein